MNANLEMLQIPLGPSTEMTGGATSSETLVVGFDTSVFVQCIFRPYTRRANPVGPISPSPSSPAKHFPTVTAKDDGLEMPVIADDTVVSMVVASDDRPVTPTDDKSDDSIVVVKGMTSFDETEGVKRRWFREEMRQSPVFILLLG